MTMSGEKLSASEFQLGDLIKINLCNPGWDTCIVCGVSDDVVEIFRPYGHIGTYALAWGRGGENGSQVTTYVGNETWKESRQDTHKRFTLISRRTLE